MNQSAIKKFATWARTHLREQASARAARYGITKKRIEEPQFVTGGMTVAGNTYDATTTRLYRQLRIDLDGRLRTGDSVAKAVEALVDEMAYTWFNRLTALRYMEVQGYIGRALSSSEGLVDPDLLRNAAALVEGGEFSGVTLDDLDRWRQDGPDAAYRNLLVAQCRALAKGLPFLFGEGKGYAPLFLPDNLLTRDSVVRRLVRDVPEEDWREIEIIGWLYQYYISEKKDQVIGKVVKSEDIPAATQLFTPNWIVKYLVQNSLGAQWLATYPDSPLKEQMKYYIEPAEQTDEVNAQLAAITPSQLNPEELTLIDPASGSGHILVEAYELFKAIYLERGYRQRDVVKLILEKNLFGLDIDERAAQLTGFALMMKGRADDRRLFERGVKLNVMALVDSAGFKPEELAHGVELEDYSLKLGDLTELKLLFEHATTIGSLIQVPEEMVEKLPAMKELSETTSQDLFVSESVKRLGPLVQQAELLAAQYDAVVANPPFMGSRYMDPVAKQFTKNVFTDAKADLFACFIDRGLLFAKRIGRNAMVTMQSWMFLSSFEKLRKRLLREKTIRTMAHFGPGGFDHASAMVVQTTAFVLENQLPPQVFRPTFFRLIEGDELKKRTALVRGERRFNSVSQGELSDIPGSPLAYWVSSQVRRIFRDNVPLGRSLDVRQGMATTDNSRFLRHWHEIALGRIGFGYGSAADGNRKGFDWFPYNKGGEFRKWYGNNHHVIHYEEDGKVLIDLVTKKYPRISDPEFVIKNRRFYFRPSITWTFVGILLGVRHSDPGSIFDVGGSSNFLEDPMRRFAYTGLLCSKVTALLIEALNPTLNFQVENIQAIPEPSDVSDSMSQTAKQAVGVVRRDWDAYEHSWNFQSFPILTASSEPTPTLESSYTAWITKNKDTIAEMKRLEEENNHLFIDAYGLTDELTPDVPIEQITLTVNPAYRYGGKLTEEEKWTRFRQDTIKELISYAVGCMMGRYSLDEPGLIHAGQPFDPARHQRFPADPDAILPITDAAYFDDDIVTRFVAFLREAYDPDHLQENLDFIADALTRRKGESALDRIRRYFVNEFIKDHIRTYSKRPIYWLFTSGKKRAFGALVYLHRYDRDTLARMRNDYALPLQSKLDAQIAQAERDAEAASSASEIRTAERTLKDLREQRQELLEYQEQLQHLADQRIDIDLDDGVAYNYTLFEGLVYEGSDLKMAAMKKRSQWKRDLLAEA